MDSSALSYFYGLEGQRFWVAMGTPLHIETDEGSIRVIRYPNHDEWMLSFGQVQVTEENKHEEPIAATIEVTAGPLDDSSSILCCVSSANMDRLKNFLRSAETDEARTSRLEAEKRANEEKQRILNEMARIKKTLRFDYDKFRDITFIKHPVDSQEKSSRRPYLLPYIGHTAKDKWYFVRAQLYADSWYFVDQAMVLIGQDERYSTPEYRSYDENVTRETTYGGIYECIDFRGTNADVDALARAIAAAPLGTCICIRLAGDYALEGELSKDEHQAWRDIMFYYDHLVPED